MFNYNSSHNHPPHGIPRIVVVVGGGDRLHAERIKKLRYHTHQLYDIRSGQSNVIARYFF